MEKYKLLADIWVQGIESKAGDFVHMFEAEAKYLRHALQKVVAKVSPAAASAVDPVGPAEEETSEPAPVLGAAVEEHPVVSQGKRRRQ
jgi:hypothetical protein